MIDEDGSGTPVSIAWRKRSLQLACSTRAASNTLFNMVTRKLIYEYVIYSYYCMLIKSEFC